MDWLSQILQNKSTSGVLSPEQEESDYMNSLLGQAPPIPNQEEAFAQQRVKEAIAPAGIDPMKPELFPPEIYNQELKRGQEMIATRNEKEEAKRLQEKLNKLKNEPDDAAELRDKSLGPISERGMAESLKARSGDVIIPPEEAPLAQSVPIEEDLSLSNLPRMKATEDSAPTDYMKALLAAQDQSKELAAYQMMGKGAERIGSAISRTAHDKDYLNEMNPMIQQPVMDVMNKQKLGLAGLDEQSKRRDIAFRQDMDDPNGNASQMYRSTAKKLIASSPTLQGINLPDNISASEMEKFSPMLFNVVSADLARQAKSADMKVKLGAQAEKQEKDQSEKNSKKAERFRNALNNQTRTQQNIYDQRMQMVDDLQDYMANPRDSKGFRDIALTYGFIKGRDDSAVREGEIKLLGEAGSLPDRARRAMNRALRGETYNQADMASLMDVLKTENKALSKAYKARAANVAKQAEKEGLDLSDIVRRDMYGLDDDLQESKFSPAQEVGINKVMKDNKINREQAIEALKKAGKL